MILKKNTKCSMIEYMTNKIFDEDTRHTRKDFDKVKKLHEKFFDTIYKKEQ